jgi:uncharacterized low-complexity protein
MQIKHRWWIAAATAGALTLMVSAGAVMAQTPSGTDTPPAESTPATSTTPQSQTPQSEQTPNSGGEAKPEGGLRRGCGLKEASLSELATFLGTDEATLRTELRADGATLSSVAQAHGQSRDALITFLTEQFQANLDEKVAEGDLTQDEADARLTEFTATVGERIDVEGGLRFGGRHGDEMRPPSGAPGSDTTPSSESSS